MRKKRVLLHLFIIVATMAILSWLYCHNRLNNSYESYFQIKDGSVEVKEGRNNEITLLSRDNSKVKGTLILPSKTEAPHAAVVLMGGLRTGRRAAELIPKTYLDRGIAVLSLDYHLAGHLPMPGEKARWYHYLQYPSYLFTSVENIIDAADYLAKREDIDANRIALVGVSFGIYFVPAAMAAQKRYSAMAIVYGGAPMGKMAEHNFTVIPASFRPAIGTLVDLLVAPLEPTKHLSRIRERPVLYIVSTEDEQIPMECIKSVENSIAGPKTIDYLKTRHVNPRNKKLISKLASKAMDWLEERLLD